MNIHGSALVPNNWELQGKEDDAEQADWYLAMFSACEKRGLGERLRNLGLAGKYGKEEPLCSLRSPCGGCDRRRI